MTDHFFVFKNVDDISHDFPFALTRDWDRELYIV